MERTSKRNRLSSVAPVVLISGHDRVERDECNSIVCVIELRICRKHDEIVSVRGVMSRVCLEALVRFWLIFDRARFWFEDLFLYFRGSRTYFHGFVG